MVKHNSINDFIKVYFLHCFVQRHASAIVVSHLQVHYFLCEVYPGVCLTTEEKAQKNLSLGSRRMPVGTMKTEYTEHTHN